MKRYVLLVAEVDIPDDATHEDTAVMKVLDDFRERALPALDGITLFRATERAVAAFLFRRADFAEAECLDWIQPLAFDPDGHR